MIDVMFVARIILGLMNFFALKKLRNTVELVYADPTLSKQLMMVQNHN